MEKFILYIFTFLCCMVSGIPVIANIKVLYNNIMIFKCGEKFSGKVSRYKLEHWNCGHDITWFQAEIRHKQRFDVALFKLKPCTVNVYYFNGKANFGKYSIVKYIIYLAFSLALWIVLIFIISDNIKGI